MNVLIAQNENLTMSSREIAELTGKEHRHVFRDCNVMFDQLDIEPEGYDQIWTHPQNGRKYHEYILPKNLAITLVSGYSVKMRHAIVERWSELEAVQVSKLPSPTELALMVIESEKQKEIAQLEVSRLQGVCNTITAQFTPGVTAPKFCKQLNGVNTQQVNNTLVSMGILLKRKDGFVPSSYARDRYFIERQESHGDKLRSHAELTLVGAKWLYRAYLSNKLPMKANWDNKFIHVVFEG